MRRLTPPSTEDEGPTQNDAEVVDDIGAGETHDEAYHRLRVSEEGSSPRFSGFTAQQLEEVSSCITSTSGGSAHGLLRIIGHLLDQLTYMCESRGVEEATTAGGSCEEEGEEGDGLALMQNA